jgi:hypothetical protein
MMDSHATRGDLRETVFDLKHDPAAWSMSNSSSSTWCSAIRTPIAELTGNKGNIALLKMAADAGLIVPGELAETVRNAYRDYRRMQHGLAPQRHQGPRRAGRSRRRVTAVREVVADDRFCGGCDGGGLQGPCARPRTCWRPPAPTFGGNR